jgi:hypothetical protein
VGCDPGPAASWEGAGLAAKPARNKTRDIIESTRITLSVPKRFASSLTTAYNSQAFHLR